MEDRIVAQLFIWAREESRRWNSRGAIFLYDQIIRREPDNMDAWWGKGCQYQFLRYHESSNELLAEEIACYEELLSLDEGQVFDFLWMQKAEAHLEFGQREQAVLCYDRFLEICDREEWEDCLDGIRCRMLAIMGTLQVGLDAPPMS